MAGSLNKVCLIGNLGQDPEVKSFQNGGRVCNLRIATSESWKDKNTGDRQERTEWHSVAIHSDGLVDVADRYLRKGSKVYIEGQLRTRKWQDQSGNDRYTTEVTLQGPAAKLVMLGDPANDRGGDSRGESRRGYDDRNDSRGSRSQGERNRDDRGGGRSDDRRGNDRQDNYGGQRGGNQGGGGYGSFADDLDDDIPF